MTSPIRKVHDFLTVGAPAPLQAAGAIGMAFGTDYYNEMALEYRERRDVMVGGAKGRRVQVLRAGRRVLHPRRLHGDQ